MLVRMFAEYDVIESYPSDDSTMLKSDRYIKCCNSVDLLNNPVPIVVHSDELSFFHYDKETDTMIYEVDFHDIEAVY
ncbi:hypothetical protein Blastoid_3 [Bacillus phage Blastoid]|uniref:Uncharacterized protein n=1 Tax=Bacillus phage Blastoid TaxID=2880540 RepID=U5PW30_9CAUD|nr:hypothetical protein V456_gp03 [Bacillus phage Blastoid]AGY46802.1 hypothetical protein Blastoid_3 [Bacillus phage Blastoid]